MKVITCKTNIFSRDCLCFSQRLEFRFSLTQPKQRISCGTGTDSDIGMDNGIAKRENEILRDLLRICIFRLDYSSLLVGISPLYVFQDPFCLLISLGFCRQLYVECTDEIFDHACILQQLNNFHIFVL